eukprot:NODE_6867_length_273_cov_605.589286_g6255_i0.p1 GENE.NODE_6867_length_273_cov_605.589286_g6255_i0~~NODE_6867_length_273_cov_605.589286_g6255_i0.p1  ORF type:complete len:63 (+),score=12.44 NODE_6867_length_273_cov_605.589286_g6255_i0:30-218(+)
MGTTMGEMKTVVKAVTDAGLRDKVKIIVGGAPVTEEYAQSAGADGYAKDANAAVKRCLEMLA